MLGTGADSVSVLDAVSSTVRDAIDGVAGDKIMFLINIIHCSGTKCITECLTPRNLIGTTVC